MKRLNNKGYMLVEIILAFALAMTIMYFITELTIKVKNKNDELLVRTLVSTDQAIIYNTIMREYYAGNKMKQTPFGNITINGKKRFVCQLDGGSKKTIFLNEYIDYFKYEQSEEIIKLSVDEFPDYNFNIVVPSGLFN